MVSQSATLLILRSVSAALLIGWRSDVFVASFCIDQAFYCLQKLARNDGWYWVPASSTAVSIFAISIPARFFVKLAVDYSGYVFGLPGGYPTNNR
jgi:hypothetical protein